MSPNPGNPYLVEAPIAAMRARMSRERLIRAIQQGELSGRKVGALWMVDGRSLAAFVARRPPTEEPGDVEFEPGGTAA
jgi:hypothetical protein